MMYKIHFLNDGQKDVAFTEASTEKEAVNQIRKRFKRNIVIIQSVSVYKTVQLSKN